MPPNTPTTITTTDVSAGIPPELADSDSAMAVVTDLGSSDATTAGLGSHPARDQRDAQNADGAAVTIAMTIEITLPRML